MRVVIRTVVPLGKSVNKMMQETAHENAAGLDRICKRSHQPKIET